MKGRSYYSEKRYLKLRNVSSNTVSLCNMHTGIVDCIMI